MNDWEQAELLVARLVNGKITPGSGNGRLKGDIRTDSLILEVKQTSKSYYTLNIKSLRKLKIQSKNYTPVFVIAFELRCYPFILRKGDYKNEWVMWNSLRITEETIPHHLYSSEDAMWELIKWENLRK